MIAPLSLSPNFSGDGECKWRRESKHRGRMSSRRKSGKLPSFNAPVKSTRLDAWPRGYPSSHLWLDARVHGRRAAFSKRARVILLATAALLCLGRAFLELIARMREHPPASPTGVMSFARAGSPRCVRPLLTVLAPQFEHARAACALHSRCAFVAWSRFTLRATLCATPPSQEHSLASTLAHHHDAPAAVAGASVHESVASFTSTSGAVQSDARTHPADQPSNLPWKAQPIPQFRSTQPIGISLHSVKPGCDAVPLDVADELSTSCARIATGRFVQAAGRVSACEPGDELQRIAATSLHEASVACMAFPGAKCGAFVWHPFPHTHSAEGTVAIASLCRRLQTDTSHAVSVDSASAYTSFSEFGTTGSVLSGEDVTRSSTGHVLMDAPWMPVQAARPKWAARRTSGGSVVYTLVRANCGELELTQALKVRSIEEAISVCASHSLCTAVTVWPSHGVGVMCQGLHGYEADEEAISAEAIGCDNYRHSEALVDASTGQTPTCRWTSLNSLCARGMSAALYREDGQAVCDACPPDGCPYVSEDMSAPHSPAGFNMRLQSILTRAGLCINPRAFNPSVFEHKGTTYTAVRLANGTQCYGRSSDGDWELDFGQVRPLCSGIAVCRVPSDSLVPETQACSVLDLGEPGFAQYKGMMHDFNIGAEDPRGFSFNGSVWIVAYVPVPIIVGDWQGTSQRPLLVELDRALQPKSTRVIDSEWHPPVTKPQKNWMPMVNGRELLMVHGLDPLRVCKIDFAASKCRTLGPTPGVATATKTLTQQLLRKQQDVRGAGSTLRGGTPFVHDSSDRHSWIALTHEYSAMPFGKRYTHRLVRLSRTSAGLEITYKSDAFRLPEAPNEYVSAPQDVQFAAGMIVQHEGYALVSYGISDCHAWLAKIKLPYSQADLHQPSSSQNSNANGKQSSKRQQRTKAAEILVEAPVTARGAIGADARGMAANIINIEQSVGLGVMVFDTTPPSAIYKEVWPLGAADLEHIKRRLVSSNLELCCPSLTVRHWWPIRLQPATSGLLVLVWSSELETDAPPPLTLSHVHEVWLPNQSLDDMSVRNSNADVNDHELFKQDEEQQRRHFLLLHKYQRLPERVIEMPYLAARVGCFLSSRGNAWAAMERLPDIARHSAFVAIAIGDSPWASGLDATIAGFQSSLAFERTAALIVIARRGLNSLVDKLGLTRVTSGRNSSGHRATSEMAVSSGNIIVMDDKELVEEEELIASSDVLISVPRLGVSPTSIEARARACAVPVISSRGGSVRSYARSCELDTCNAEVREHFNSRTVFGATWSEPVHGDVAEALLRAYSSASELPRMAASSQHHISSTQTAAAEALTSAVSRLVPQRQNMWEANSLSAASLLAGSANEN